VPCLVPGIEHYAAFRPERQAKFLDFMEVHFYPLNQGFFEYRSPEEETRNLAYLESVVREVARPGKPVVVAEFGWYGGGKLSINGGQHAPASEEQQARWCRRLIETTSGLATGWLNWGLYDHPRAGDVTRTDGLADQLRQPQSLGPRVQPAGPRLSQGPFSRAMLEGRPTLDWDLCVTSARGQMSSAKPITRRRQRAWDKMTNDQ